MSSSRVRPISRESMYNSVMASLSSTPDAQDTADLRRREVLEAAADLLATEGPGGLTLRRVAAAAGGSTQLVYTLFGGKPGLADGLYAEGFARMVERTRGALALAPPAGDPERVVACGQAYCAFAREETGFFSLMFGRVVPGFAPRTETRRASRAASMGLLVATVTECLEAGTLEAPDAVALAQACWATAHGVASLLVAGLLPDDPDAVTAMLQVPVRAHRPS